MFCRQGSSFPFTRRGINLDFPVGYILTQIRIGEIIKAVLRGASGKCRRLSATEMHPLPVLAKCVRSVVGAISHRGFIWSVDGSPGRTRDLFATRFINCLHHRQDSCPDRGREGREGTEKKQQLKLRDLRVLRGKKGILFFSSLGLRVFVVIRVTPRASGPSSLRGPGGNGEAATRGSPAVSPR